MGLVGLLRFIDTDYKDNPGNSGTFTVSGENLSGGGFDKNVLGYGGLEIVQNVDSDDIHLGYTALLIKNLTKNSVGTEVEVTLDKPVISDPADPYPTTGDIVIANNTDNMVKFCAYNDSTCAYKSDSNCKKDGKIPAGGSCKLWFKAKDISELGEKADIKITVKAYGHYAEGTTTEYTKPDPETDEFTIKHKQLLYVGGHFLTAHNSSSSSISAYNIAVWNGSSWARLRESESGLNSIVYGLAIMKGDLYMGGTFDRTASGSYLIPSKLVKWNGVSLSRVGNDTDATNGRFYDIKNIDDEMYVIGDFTVLAGTPANRVGKWTGSTWSPLGDGLAKSSAFTTGIYAHTASKFGSEIYVGGLFGSAGDSVSDTQNIAKWNGSGWSAVVEAGDVGANNRVNGLFALNNDLYVVGSFTALGGLSLNRVAKLNGITWSNIGSGISNTHVYSIYPRSNDEIYAGASRFQYATTTNKWDGSNWSVLGGSVNGDVFSMVPFGDHSVGEPDNFYIGGNFNAVDIYNAQGAKPMLRIGKLDVSSGPPGSWEWESLGEDGGGISGGLGWIRDIVIAPSLEVTHHESYT